MLYTDELEIFTRRQWWWWRRTCLQTW